MVYDPEKHRRRSIRLDSYDYSRCGAYFITLCTEGSIPIFGTIENGEMFLNNVGTMVREEWLKSAQIRSEIELDEFVIMPNHLHGIIFIRDMAELPVGATRGRPLPCGPKSRSIGAIIGGFKSAVTHRINEQQNTQNVIIWQRSYFEHIIHNENSLNKIRCYIRQNPLNWSLDNERDSLIKFVSSLNCPVEMDLKP